MSIDRQDERQELSSGTLRILEDEEPMRWLENQWSTLYLKPNKEDCFKEGRVNKQDGRF